MTMQVAAVSESGALWGRRVVNLALSLSTGPTGEHLDAASVVFVDGIDPRHAGILRALGMASVAAHSVRPRSPLNKIRMFELADPAIPMAALDCDVLVTGDLSPALAADRLAAVPAEFPLLDEVTWHRLYRDLGLPLLDEPILASVSGQRIPVPYLNSGVLLLPGAWCRELATTWTTFAERLDHHPVLTPWTPALEFHLEQIALACAVSALELPLTILPLAYNLPFRTNDADEVVVLHYHRRMRPDGTLDSPPSTAGREAVSAFNELLQRTGLTGAIEG